MKISRLGPAAILIAALALLLTPQLAVAAPTVGVYDSLTVLRPEKAAPSGAKQSAEIELARNETTSFQLSVVASSGAVSALKVEAGAPLTSPSGNTIPAEDVTIYREGTYAVTQRSDAEGETGNWPDVLIPSRDVLYHEARNAFPVDVASGSQMGIWVDVFAPAAQAAGTYTGSLTVSASTGTIAAVPVKVQVQNFALPSTSTFKSAFHVDPWQICQAFTGAASCTSQQQWWELEAEFAEVGLDNRITISNPYPTGFNAAPTSSSQRSYFATYIVPLLNGTDPRVRLSGAKLTSFDAYWQCVTESTTCLGTWKSLAAEYGFSERFFLYDCDEPSGSAAWSKCASTASAAERSWAGVRKLVTASASELEANGASGYTTVDTPLVNELDSGSVDRRASYEPFLAKAPSSHELWLYTSCMSFSCDASENPYWNGWPGYAIDEPASQAQSMGWMGYGYQASGELYYETTESLTTATTNQYYSGGNGDGNLFYAGTPNGGNGSVAIGGSRPIPLETIRLKRIRDGYENYEYLRLAESAQGRAAAMGVFEGLFGNLGHAMNNSTVSGSALMSARAKLSAMIAAPVVETEVPRTPEPPTTPEQPVTPPEAPVSPAPEATPLPPVVPTPVVEPPVSVSTSTPPAGRVTVTAETPLQVKVEAVQVPKQAAGLRHRAPRVKVGCSGRCKIEVAVEVSGATASRYGLADRKIGRTVATIKSGAQWLILRPSPAALERIDPAASISALGLKAVVSARGPAGIAATQVQVG